MINKTTTIAAMGSCFARELHRELGTRGYPMLPTGTYASKLLWYNTWSIRYEFERALGRQRPPDVRDGLRWENPPESRRPGWQDPQRRLVIAPTLEELGRITLRIDARMRAAIEGAEVFVLTLGLSEVWRSKATGFILCAHPAYGVGPKSGGMDRAEFHNATEAQNYENLIAIRELLAEHRPGARVIVSVSPVPLRRTFTNLRLEEANRQSKAKLVGAAKTMCRKDLTPNWSYFDSYEFVTGLGPEAYKSDGRHVRPEAVGQAIERFEKRYMSPGGA